MPRSYCTAVITVKRGDTPEDDSASVSFECRKGECAVSACRYFHPMRCADGSRWRGECQHFDHSSCRSVSAREEAASSAKRVLKKELL